MRKVVIPKNKTIPKIEVPTIDDILKDCCFILNSEVQRYKKQAMDKGLNLDETRGFNLQSNTAINIKKLEQSEEKEIEKMPDEELTTRALEILKKIQEKEGKNET